MLQNHRPGPRRLARGLPVFQPGGGDLIHAIWFYSSTTGKSVCKCQKAPFATLNRCLGIAPESRATLTESAKESLPKKVKARTSPHHRFVIALHSPGGVVETGLLMCPSEKKAPNIASGVQRDTFSSPVFQQNVRNCGHFARFSEECWRFSLHHRLRGGASGIRTLSTFLNL